MLSDEYPCTRVSVFFQLFVSFCIGQISHQQHKGYTDLLDVRLTDLKVCDHTVLLDFPTQNTFRRTGSMTIFLLDFPLTE